MHRLRQKHVAPDVSAADTFNLQQVSDGIHGCSKRCGEFVDAGVKINGTYYREMLLIQKLLPAMREICAVFFT